LHYGELSISEIKDYLSMHSIPVRNSPESFRKEF